MENAAEPEIEPQPSKATAPATRDKAFACTHPGCTKRFTRAEHLQRHALNHAPGEGHVCSLCRAFFHRPDLLNRHMERHRQKDIEAGGPGRGVLDTRKRAWKDRDGSLKEDRPYRRPTARSRKNTHAAKTTIQQQPSPSDDERRNSESSACQSIDNQGGLEFSSAPSVEDIQFSNQDPAGIDAQGIQVDPAPGNIGVPFGAYPQQHPETTGQIEPRSWDDSFSFDVPIYGYDELDYEQFFQPDTASSFNMPFTTALDYGWLFNAKPTSLQPSQKVTQLDLPPQGLAALSPVSTNSSQLWPVPSHPSLSEAEIASNNSFNHHSPPMAAPPVDKRTAPVPTTAPPAATVALRHDNDNSIRIQGRSQTTPTNLVPDPERPFSTLDGTLNVPELHDATRQNVLEVVESANPCLPDSACSIWDHPLLSLTSLQSDLELFFSRFNTAYPLMHLPTFDPNDVEPLLLLSMLLLGATYSSKECHQLAVCIHDVIRPSIFAHAGFSAQPTLWSLQTILLVECFGKSRAGLKQHEMSHLFHGLLINLIRRSDCQSVRPAGPATQEQDLEKAWRQWAVAEQKKRLALLCFMWDTQHAVLFCQSLCMSSFELRTDLPCTQSIWEAQDSAAWVSAWRCTPSALLGIPYLMALKSYLSPSTPTPPSMDSLSRVLLLHGIMSVAWDMQRRDQTALGLDPVGDGTDQSWKKIITFAYDTWQSHFDAHCAGVIARLQDKTNSNMRNYQSSIPDADRETCHQMSVFASCYTALARCAQALLNMEFLDVQIYAGARHILGRPVQQRDYVRSAEVVKRWAATMPSTASPMERMVLSSGRSSQGVQLQRPPQCATVAATHAAHILHEHLDHLTEQDAMSLFHVPWCLYLLTLTLWAFHHARPVEPPAGGITGGDWGSFGSDGDDEMIWDPRGEMRALVSEMMDQKNQTNSRVSRRRTNGLVWIMAETLTKVRWGIIHAGVSVLKGLVPQRLINQYDDPIE